MIRLSVIGHLGHDALKKDINGKTVLSFSVAQNEQFKSLKGVVRERTTWINCSVWGRDNLAPYLRKGSLVYVEGRPAFRGYVDKRGEALAGVNMMVMELALLPGARGVLGTGSTGIEEENLAEVPENEGFDDEEDDDEEEEVDDEENEEEEDNEEEGEEKEGDEEKEDDEGEVLKDGIRSDLPF